MVLGADYAFALLSTSAADDLLQPFAEREAPMTSNKHTAKDIYNLNPEGEKAVAALLDVQQDGFDVVLEEETGD